MKSQPSARRVIVVGLFASVIAACAGSSSGNSTNDVEGNPPARTTDPTSPTDPSPSSPAPTPAPPGSPNGGETPAGPCQTTPPSNACGLAPQCGCGTGSTCIVIDFSGRVGCVTAGQGALGSTCTENSQCGVGLTCARGACRPYCAASGEACTGTGLGVCGVLQDSGGAPIGNAKVCTVSCDLRDASVACGSNACLWNYELGASDCGVAGTKQAREKCTRTEECAVGLACVNRPAYGSTCERWCRIGKDGDCGTLSMCVNDDGSKAPTQGTDKLGHCQ